MNLIEYKCDTIISQWYVSTLDHFVLRQFSHIESFRTAVRTDPVAVWVFLSHRCTRTLCWRTDCTCESQSWWCDRWRSSLMFRISVISNVAHRESQRFKICNVWRAELLLPDAAGWASVIELWRYRPCKECVIFLRALCTIQHKHLTLTLSLLTLYVQYNDDLLLENRAIVHSGRRRVSLDL